MRILFLSNKPPYPKLDGGCVAIADMLSYYITTGHEVDMITISTRKHPFSEANFPANVLEKTNVDHVELDTSINPFEAFAYLFKSGSYNVARFLDQRMVDLIDNKLQLNTYDIVHFDSLYTLPYLEGIKAQTSAPCIYRAHNIEHRIWQEKAEEGASGLKRSYLKKLSKDLEAYENKELVKPDAIVAITPNDAQFFVESGFPGIIHIHPVGLEFATSSTSWNETPRLFHIGAMDWEPNIHGINWFLEEVWDSFAGNEDAYELHLAGKSLSTDFGLAYKGIHNHGEVQDATGFIDAYEVMIVPLFSGSGLRIKIIEAMALGKLVISTGIGIRGIQAKPDEHILVADDAATFQEKIKWTLQHPDEAKRIAEQGKALAIQFYERNAVYQRYTAFIDKLMTNIQTQAT